MKINEHLDFIHAFYMILHLSKHILCLNISYNVMNLMAMALKVKLTHFSQEAELCHYHGKIENRPQSWAAVSTCDGGIRLVISSN